MKKVILPVLLELARFLGAPVYLSGVLSFGKRLYADSCVTVLLFVIASVFLSILPITVFMQAVKEGSEVHACEAIAMNTALWAVGRYVQLIKKHED